MATTVTVSRNDIAPGSGKVVDAGGKPIAVFNVDGAYYAIDNTCVHRGGPLGEGLLDGSAVTCPWHGWAYDLKTGACQTVETAKVATYPVRVEGDQLAIEVP